MMIFFLMFFIFSSLEAQEIKDLQAEYRKRERFSSFEIKHIENTSFNIPSTYAKKLKRVLKTHNGQEIEADFAEQCFISIAYNKYADYQTVVCYLQKKGDLYRYEITSADPLHRDFRTLHNDLFQEIYKYQFKKKSDNP